MTPKIKAWHKEQNRMFIPGAISYDEKGNPENVFERGNNNKWKVEEEVELLQSIGILDKEGKDIYQDDILEDDEGKRFLVLYRIGSWMIERKLHPEYGDDDEGWQFDNIQEMVNSWSYTYGSREVFDELPHHKIVGTYNENPDFQVKKNEK